MKRTSVKSILLILSVVYTLTLLTVSLIKINTNDIPVSFKFADKVFHFFAYSGLTLVWHFFLFKKDSTKIIKPYTWVCLSAVAFGIVIEVLQYALTNYRSFEFWDILANSLGVFLGWAILKIIQIKIKARYLKS